VGRFLVGNLPKGRQGNRVDRGNKERKGRGKRSQRGKGLKLDQTKKEVGRRGGGRRKKGERKGGEKGKKKLPRVDSASRRDRSSSERGGGARGGDKGKRGKEERKTTKGLSGKGKDLLEASRSTSLWESKG